MDKASVYILPGILILSFFAFPDTISVIETARHCSISQDSLSEKKKKAQLEQMESKIEQLKRIYAERLIPVRDTAYRRGFLDSLLSSYYKGDNSRHAEALFLMGNFCYDSVFEMKIWGDKRFQKGIFKYDTLLKIPDTVYSPSYTESKKYFENLVHMYPHFSKIGEVYRKLFFIYSISPEYDQDARLLDVYPGYFYNYNTECGPVDYECLLNDLGQINLNELDLKSRQMVHYRMGEFSFKAGRTIQALNYFYSFIDSVEIGRYKEMYRGLMLQYIVNIFFKEENQNQLVLFIKNRKGLYRNDILFMLGRRLAVSGNILKSEKILHEFLREYPSDPFAPLAEDILSRIKN